jgi:hypothetical protein
MDDSTVTQHNPIVISSGHGLHIRGARGNPVPPQLDEVDEARKVVDRVAKILSDGGVTVKTFHDNTSYDQDTNLKTIVKYHNSQKRTLDVSCHFNATPGAHGTEVWYATQGDLAAKVSLAIADAGGFTNRGAKKNGLYFLNNTAEPAILLEVCFCDSTSDSNLYRANFERICHAIAASIAGKALSEKPPEPPPIDVPVPPERPPWVDDPLEVPLEQRPVIGPGDNGHDVEDLQHLLNLTELAPDLEEDGDYGNRTETAVMNYQATRGLAADGICGEETWAALYDSKPPLPPPPHALGERDIEAICAIADASEIAEYSWQDRGVAPPGFTEGMALAFAQTCRKLQLGHHAAIEMAKARTGSDKDALNIYRSKFDAMGMSNEVAGVNTLRHLYALMLGSGMRESSGRHCEGRDLSATNVSSDTAEAGLFQTSWNAHSASDPEFSNLMAEYSNPRNAATCYLTVFDDGVNCTDDEWGCYGSGQGYAFQKLCKECPAFAVETHGLTLRNLANHYGPIIRKEVELKTEADEMFREVQDYVDTMDVA